MYVSDGYRVRYPLDYTRVWISDFDSHSFFGFFLLFAIFAPGPIKTVPANLFGGDAHTCELLTYRNNYEKTTTRFGERFLNVSVGETSSGGARSARIRPAAAAHMYTGRFLPYVLRQFKPRGRMQRRFAGKKCFWIFSENGGFDGRPHVSGPRISRPFVRL